MMNQGNASRTSGMAVFLNFDSGPRQLFPQAVIQQAIVAFAIPLLAALAPILNNVRMTVRETLSDYGIGQRIKRKKKVSDVGKHFHPAPHPTFFTQRHQTPGQAGTHACFTYFGRRHFHLGL